MNDAEAPPRRRPTARLAAAFLVSEGLVLAALMGPLLAQPWWAGFRRYFSNDQLSYAAIAANVAAGSTSMVEPFTLTGSLFYPSLWYQVIGAVSGITGLPVHLVWTLLGVVVVSGAVLAVGWLAWRVSGAAFAPVLPAAALFTGVLAIPTAQYWYATLGDHAVLWGPFGTLFALNAEVAGLSIVAIAMTMLVAAHRGICSGPRGPVALVLGAAALVGLLANIQTYSFFTALVLVALFVAVCSLLVDRSPARTLATAGLLVGALAVGRQLSGTVSPFPILGLVLLSLAPAAWPQVRRRPGLTMAAIGLVALTSAPQIVRTLLGLAGQDPFLTYRQSSSVNLGVMYPATALAVIPLVLIAAVCAIALWRRGEATLSALLIAPLGGLVLMSTNDQWGFGQEPYRFWLQFTILALMLLAPVLAWSLVQGLRMTRRRGTAFVVATVAAAAIWLVSLADVASFWGFARDKGVIAMDDERLVAARSLVGDAPGIVMSSACLDPQVLKQATRGPVAFYNRGLAWPAQVEDFEIFKDVARRAGADPVALRAAGVSMVLTDSACPTEWVFPATQEVLRLRSLDYVMDGQQHTLTLWWVARS